MSNCQEQLLFGFLPEQVKRQENNTKPVKVLLADDHPIVREGFKVALEKNSSINIVAEADSGESCCKLYKMYAPDVVTLDLHMPGMDGFEIIRRLKAIDCKVKILVFSIAVHEAIIRRILELGAKGYLDKRTSLMRLIEAIYQVALGKLYLDPEQITHASLQKLFSTTADPIELLSTREFQVFKMLAEGYSTAEIAGKLYISAKTVGGHHVNIINKLKVDNNSQLTRLAIRNKIIEP